MLQVFLKKILISFNYPILQCPYFHYYFSSLVCEKSSYLCHSIARVHTIIQFLQKLLNLVGQAQVDKIAIHWLIPDSEQTSLCLLNEK